MGRSFCVGLAGGSGAGKSALARELELALGPERVLLLAHDAYYRDRPELDPAARAAQNFDHPDALETELLAAQLDLLRAGRAVDVPSYDFAQHRRRGETRRAEPREVIVVDGLLVLCDPSLRARFDLCVFVAAPEPLRLERRLARDVAERGRSAESVRAQLAATVAPMYAAFVEPSRAHADLVVANDAELARACAPLLARVRALLEAG
jgi:uridine kinase